MNIDELLKLRWKALGIIGLEFKYIKSRLLNNYGIDVAEGSLEEFIKNYKSRYSNINHQEILFDLEDSSYKKVSVFTIREKNADELKQPNFEMFLRINLIEKLVNNKTIEKVGKSIFPCYISSNDRYVTIKMCQLRNFMKDNVGEYGEVSSQEITYYHYAKFIIDKENELVFFFYNDIDGSEANNKGLAITEKKKAFYNLFEDGNRATLNSYRFDEYLNSYARKLLENIDCSSEELENEDKYNKAVLIETVDPCKAQNNLRSSKEDGRHNKFRLAAINNALEEEGHNIRTLGCIIDNRWFQFKNIGEIMTGGPYFDREVIENVCREVFPQYKLPQENKLEEKV